MAEPPSHLDSKAMKRRVLGHMRHIWAGTCVWWLPGLWLHPSLALQLGLPLCRCQSQLPHGHSMAAAAPAIPSSYNHIQRQKQGPCSPCVLLRNLLKSSQQTFVVSYQQVCQFSRRSGGNDKREGLWVGHTMGAPLSPGP